MIRLAAVPALAHVAAATALVLAAGAGAWSVSTAGPLAGFAAIPAAAAVAALAVGLVAGLAVLVGPSAALLVTAYGLSVLGSGSGLRADAAVVGPVAWLAVEAAWWSLEARRPVRLAPGLATRRVAVLAGGAAGSGAVGLVLLDLAGTGAGGGALLKALGVAAALGIAGLVAALARTGDRPVRA